MKEPEEAPDGLRASTLRIGDEELVVLSYPVELPDLRSDTPLSDAEAEVAGLAIRGRSNREIAEIRGTSVRTVANQMASVLRKLEVSSRRELAARYVRGELGEDG
ncbi:MAG TPA: helix-turn-helix transcriptional regulator [Sandaracinaceae bacterium LLY-WYZ-13_1]|nr:helix-turn-helix transcriptional regulator [Sandaracinaceae bacterium LLY-WYZ-13_1]